MRRGHPLAFFIHHCRSLSDSFHNFNPLLSQFYTPYCITLHPSFNASISLVLRFYTHRFMTLRPLFHYIIPNIAQLNILCFMVLQPSFRDSSRHITHLSSSILIYPHQYHYFSHQIRSTHSRYTHVGYT